MGNLCMEKKDETDSSADESKKIKTNNYYDKNTIASPNKKDQPSRDSGNGGGYNVGNAVDNQLVVIGRDIAGPKVSPKITADFAARVQNDDSFKSRPIEAIALENDNDNREFRSNNSALVDSRLVALPSGLSGAGSTGNASVANGNTMKVPRKIKNISKPDEIPKSGSESEGPKNENQATHKRLNYPINDTGTIDKKYFIKGKGSAEKSDEEKKEEQPSEVDRNFSFSKD